MKLLSYLNPSDKEQLSILVNDELPFQFLPQFTNFHSEFYHDKLCIIYSSELDAYLPVLFYKSKMFRLGQIIHAPINAANHIELLHKEQLLFFNAFIRFLKENNMCQRLIQPHPYGLLGALPPNVQSCEFGTYIIDLAGQTEEQIFKKIHPKYQKAVAHSQKHEAVVKFGKEVFDDFYFVYESTMKRVNMRAESKNYFHSLYKHLGETYLTPGVVYDNGAPIGSVFFIHTKYAGYCTHAGSRGESKLYGAIKLLHYEMMIRLKNLGVRRYDLVGVRLKNNNPALEGIFHFKKGFGGDLKTGYLWKTDIQPIKAKLYDILAQIKNRNKNINRDIIDQVNS